MQRLLDWFKRLVCREELEQLKLLQEFYAEVQAAPVQAGVCCSW